MIINEKTGLYQDYGLWHVPFWQTYTFIVGLKIFAGILVFLLVVFMCTLYLRYRKRKRLPVWQEALQSLEQLVHDNKVNCDHGKEFYLATSAILKQYLHHRFKYDLLGKTDSELVHYLQQKNADKDLIEKMNTILDGSMFIKFANAQAAQEQIDRDYKISIELVKKTIPSKK